MGYYESKIYISMKKQILTVSVMDITAHPKISNFDLEGCCHQTISVKKIAREA